MMDEKEETVLKFHPSSFLSPLRASVSPCLISFYFYKRKSRIVNLIYSQTVHNEQSFLDLAVQMILAVRCNILL